MQPTTATPYRHQISIPLENPRFPKIAGIESFFNMIGKKDSNHLPVARGRSSTAQSRSTTNAVCCTKSVYLPLPLPPHQRKKTMAWHICFPQSPRPGTAGGVQRRANKNFVFPCACDGRVAQMQPTTATPYRTQFSIPPDKQRNEKNTGIESFFNMIGIKDFDHPASHPAPTQGRSPASHSSSTTDTVSHEICLPPIPAPPEEKTMGSYTCFPQSPRPRRSATNLTKKRQRSARPTPT